MTDKKVDIRITGGGLSVQPDPVHVDWTNNDQVVWRGHGGTIQVKFDKGDGTPFTSSNFAAADETDKPSGMSRVTPQNTVRYNYTVTLTRPNGTVLTKDPGVDVDSGGGPPNGGHKKAGRKKAGRKKAGRKKAARRKSARKKTAKKVARKRATRKKK